MKPITYGDPYSDEAAEIERKRRLAEMLQQQGSTPLDTNRMSGGLVSRISPWEGMAKLAQGAAGGIQNARADQMAKALRDRQQGDMQGDIQAYVQALRGRPASPGGPTEDASGNVTMADPMQARPGGVSPELIQQLRTPQMQGMALQQFMQQNQPKEPKWQVTERFNPATGRPEKVMVDLNNPANVQPFGGQKAPSVQFGPGGVAFDPQATAPGTVQNNPSALVQIGPDGKPVVNQTVVQAKKDIANAGKTSITGPTVIVGKGDDKYQEERRKGQATQFAELEKRAESASRQIDTLDRFIAASKNGTAGGAQPVISGVQNLLSTFGYTPAQLKDVRVMEQAIGDILGNKMVELGARGLTDKDMEILRMALPRVATDAQSRVAIAEVLKKSANASLNEYANARAEEERIYPEFAQKTPVQAWFKDWKSKHGAAPGGGGPKPVVVDW